jgi:hypothetical protein
MTKPELKRKTKWWQIAVVIPFIPLLIFVAAIALVLHLITTILLHITIWSLWCVRGRSILFVYSDSPIWHDYITYKILPYIERQSVILNWSQRKHWRLSLKKIAFYHFGTYRKFNPLAVVFRPFRRTRIFRFWQPFRDFKHGHPDALQKMEREFFELISVQRKL